MLSLGGALGDVKVQVAESDAVRARAVLASREGRDALFEEDDYGLEERVQAGGRSRIRHSPVKADDEEDEEEVQSEADATAARAWRSAVIGLLALPPLLHFYSAWLLFQIPWTRGVLTPTGKRNVILAAVVDVLVLAALLLLLRGLLMPPPPRPMDGPPF
jgi:hypothetical protein